MLKIMERPFLLNCKHVTIAVQEAIVKWMNALVSLDEANELILGETGPCDESERWCRHQEIGGIGTLPQRVMTAAARRRES